MTDKAPAASERAQNGGSEGKWEKRNWNKKEAEDLKKMDLTQKSKYMAYEDPPKHIAEAQASSKQRLIDAKKMRKQYNMALTEDSEKYTHEKLIGQLKAAESRNRIRIMRLRYEANRGQEINHLISCQPTARKAVRLEAFLPIKPEDRTKGDTLDKLQRDRVEKLLADAGGAMISRT